MFRLPDSWVWDSWHVADGDRHHLFFLFASRALHDPHARHFRASIGHAVSTDLTNWTRLPDAVVHGVAGDVDEVATWTGSTVRGDDGLWYLYYTGLSAAEYGFWQRITVAVSPDLMTWHKNSEVCLEADPRWYEKLADRPAADEAWRDPWVFPDPDGDGWHMFITARAGQGRPSERGVVGHARSDDLLNWTVLAPATQPGYGFHQLEVTQTAEIEGRTVLVFCCFDHDLSAERRAAGQTGGTWWAPATSLTGPFDLDRAGPLTGPGRYAGRLVQRASDGQWCLIAFEDEQPDRPFLGQLTDPLPVGWVGDRLVLV